MLVSYRCVASYGAGDDAGTMEKYVPNTFRALGMKFDVLFNFFDLIEGSVKYYYPPHIIEVTNCDFVNLVNLATHLGLRKAM